MQVLIKVVGNVVIDPPGLAVGSYVEITTEVQFPVSLVERVLPMPTPPPSTCKWLFGPVDPSSSLDNVRRELVDAERERMKAMYRNILSGC